MNMVSEKLEITIRKATIEDTSFLAQFGAQVFSETYASDNDPNDMQDYLQKSFSIQKQSEEIIHPGSVFFIAYVGNTPARYARIQPGSAPACITGDRPVELVRIYASQEWIGKGVGGRLFQACMDEGRAGGFNVMWLSVWQKNQRGISFYRKWGFEIACTGTFTIGSDVQSDWLMQRSLKEEQ